MIEKELVQIAFLSDVPLDKIGTIGGGYYYELTRDCTDWGLWWYVGVRHLGSTKVLECSLYAGKLDKWLEDGSTYVRRDAFDITIENTCTLVGSDIRLYNDPEEWVIKFKDRTGVV